jgi:uncharacterized coiled-coil protein SlyX
MPDDTGARLARMERFIEQLQGFVAQQMVQDAHYDRMHADMQRFIEEQLAMNRAQEAHNQALYEMHAELRLAFVNLDARLASLETHVARLEPRLGRIEGLLERALPGSTNGRDG